MLNTTDEGTGGCCGIILFLAAAILGIVLCAIAFHVLIALLLLGGAGLLVTLVAGYFFPAFIMKLVLPIVLIVLLIKIWKIIC